MNEDTCPACERAQTFPKTGIYQASCINCEARALAHSPAAAKREADPSALQNAMRLAWPDIENYKRGRTLLWEWLKRFEAAKT